MPKQLTGSPLPGTNQSLRSISTSIRSYPCKRSRYQIDDAIHHASEWQEAIYRIARKAVRRFVRFTRGLTLMRYLHPHLGHSIRQTANTLLADKSVRIHTDLVETNRYLGLTTQQESQIHAIAKECLTNVVSHAQAGNIWLMLRTTPTGVRFAIRDDGIGVDLKNMKEGKGFPAIRQWAKNLDADLHIGSKPGQGTSIRIECPSMTAKRLKWPTFEIAIQQPDLSKHAGNFQTN